MRWRLERLRVFVFGKGGGKCSGVTFPRDASLLLMLFLLLLLLPRFSLICACGGLR